MRKNVLLPGLGAVYGSGLPPRVRASVDACKPEFEKKFGRPMRDGDPLLWDPDADTPLPEDPERITDYMAIAMADAGIPHALVWIFIKTGLMPKKGEDHLLSSQDKRALRAASREYDEGRTDVEGWLAAARARKAQRGK
jgi:hypothetical protein